MRLLHTSDWHLGQTFYHFDRTYEHGKFLEWLLQTIQEKKIDVLLITGDVFDHANPSIEAQKQLYRFLSEARRYTLNIVLIAGNHDSAGRLEAPSSVLSELGITVVGQIARNAKGKIETDSLCIPLKNRRGKVMAWCLAVPFLRMSDIPSCINGSTSDFAAGVADVYANLVKEIKNRQEGQALIAMGHCHIAGGERSEESERPIGGCEALPTSTFGSDIAYVALGHLHRAQTVKHNHSGHTNSTSIIRYSGSPFPLSFSEIHYTHEVVYIELDGEQVGELRSVQTDSIKTKRFVDMLQIPPKPAPLEDALRALQSFDSKKWEGLEKDGWPYLVTEVSLDGPQPGLRHRIEEVVNKKAMRLARIKISYPRRENAPSETMPTLESISRLPPKEVFKRLYKEKYSSEAPDEYMKAFDELHRLASEKLHGLASKKIK